MTGDANDSAAYLNRLSPDEAERELRRCCGSKRWAREMVARRPFVSDAALFSAAETVWRDLEPDDWHEAFAAHPRIGERHGGAWSAEEQAGMNDAPRRLEDEIRDRNQVYEAKFGHVFLICATGLTAAEMAESLARRLDNDPEAELRIAAAEQAKITRLRLRKLASG